MNTLPERRERLQRFRPRGPDTAQRIALQSEAYNVVGAMATQRNALTSVQTLRDAQGEIKRRLQKALIDQRRALASGDRSLALGMNQVAIALLGAVDQLATAEDADPVMDAFGCNFEAARSGRQMIGMLDEPDLLPAA